MSASEQLSLPPEELETQLPRYFFQIHDGTDIRDDVGEVLDGIEAAQHAAIRLAGDIIADNAKKMKLGEMWMMEVTDQSGLVLFRLDFYVGASPAVSAAVVRSE